MIIMNILEMIGRDLLDFEMSQNDLMQNLHAMINVSFLQHLVGCPHKIAWSLTATILDTLKWQYDFEIW